MTSVVTLMINDVDGFRQNFSLKSRYLLRPVQTKTKCSAGLGVWMSALTKVQTDRWRHRSSCVNNHRKCVDFLGDLKAAWFLCLLAQLCHCIFSLTFAISSTLPLFLSLEPCTQPLTVYGTQHADWWAWPQICRVTKLFVFLLLSDSWLLSRLMLLKLPPNVGFNDDDEKH